MIGKKSNLLFLLVFVLGTYSATQAQDKTLIYEKEGEKTIDKVWRTEFGIWGGAGVSNFFKPASNPAIAIPEEYNNYSVMYAPRPEANVGVFTEIYKPNSIVSVQLFVGYTMRAIPKPVFYTAQNEPPQEYRSTYLNGLTGGAMVFFRPGKKKFRIGVGLDATQFLIFPDVKDSEIGEYTELYKGSYGFKTVVGYQVSPRMDLNIYGRLGMNAASFKNTENYLPTDVSAGVMMSYRLFGKEHHLKGKIQGKKEVYRLNYTK